MPECYQVSNPWIWPNRPWQKIHVDFAGPLKDDMFLIVMDAKSKWIPYVIHYCNSCYSRFRFLFATHGLPEEIVSEKGPESVAQEMRYFLKSNGIRQCLSSPYHPASNREAERTVRTFKEAMKAIENESGTLTETLARCLLGYRTTPHTATSCTPGEMLMKEESGHD